MRRTMKKRERPYRIVNSERHEIGRVTVVKDTIEISGNEHPYTYVIHGDSVCVLPVYEGDVIAIKQYRHTLNEWMLEIPCGGVDEGECAEAAAYRELLEETGYVADALTHLGSYYMNQGISAARCDAFFAQCTRRECNKREETELIQVVKIPIEEFREMVENNQFKLLIGLAAWNQATQRKLL